MTLREHVAKPLQETSFCFLGDGRGNMADSYLVGCAKLGMDLRIATAPELWPREEFVEQARAVAAETGASITLTNDVEAAVRGCDALATDVWVSMGEPDEVWAERIGLLLPYQVNERVLELTGNPDVKFLHCLPAFHNAETTVGREIRERYGLEALEVTDEVFESPASIVFDEAENRLHTIKAILVATLGQLTCESSWHSAATRSYDGASRSASRHNGRTSRSRARRCCRSHASTSS